ncbi:hypothetical protein NDI49_00020 [Trichocoleus sp. ST-U3]
MEVTPIYNWEGHLISYQQGNKFVPIADDNQEYQIIKEAIKNGTCIVKEPIIEEVTKTYDRKKNWSGYRWHGIFVPIDENNYLYQIIDKAIKDNICIVNEPEEEHNATSSKIKTIIFCVLFDQPWHRVEDFYEGKMPYRSNPKAQYVDYNFRLINLPINEKLNAANFLFEYYEIAKEKFPIEISMKIGMLELEVPVKYLLKLFRTEKELLEENTANIIEDILKQNLKEFGRKESEGANILVLIQYAKSYLENFIMELGNRIIEAYAGEYRELPIGYINKWKIHEKTFVINKFDDGTYDLGTFGLSERVTPKLSGKWQQNFSFLQVAQPEAYLKSSQNNALRRVRMLVDSGFHMEGFCLLNAFLEVNVEDAICECIKADKETEDIIRRKDHKILLEVLEEIGKSAKDNSFYSEEYLAKIEKAKEIYKHRNAYVHALELPEKEKTLSLKQRRVLESLMYEFMDEWESRPWYESQERLASGNDASAISIIQKFITEWRQKKVRNSENC